MYYPHNSILYGQVYVRPVLTVVAVAVVVNLIAFVILATGVVHQHHVVGEQLFVTVFLKERHRGMMLRLHRIALGIGTHIVEFRRRNTQVQLLQAKYEYIFKTEIIKFYLDSNKK